MVYSAQMRDLAPPRSRSVTVAAFFVLLTGFFWLGSCGLVFWGRNDFAGLHPGAQQKVIVAVSLLGCASVGTVIVGFGVLLRRNWAHIFAIVVAGPWILFGWSFLSPLLRLPAPLAAGGLIITLCALPIGAGVGWLALLVGKKVRTEFLPLAAVEIYVNLLDAGTPRSRPTRALDWGNGLFELLPTEDYNPTVELWEFLPGSFVHAETPQRDGASYLLAVSLDA
jgi:hypothetical protein